MAKEWSKLRPMIADSKEDGPDTVLVLKGFADAEEIQDFMDALLEHGIVKPNQKIVS